MPRLFFIAVLFVFVGATGFSSRQYFKGVPTTVAPIVNSKSFYVIDASFAKGGRSRRIQNTLVRVDPDGSIYTIGVIDSAYGLWYQRARDTAVVLVKKKEFTKWLYNIRTGQITPLPKGYKFKGKWVWIDGIAYESLKRQPPVQGMKVIEMLLLGYKESYLVKVEMTESGDFASATDGGNDSDADKPFSISSAESCWAIVDMKKNTITKLAENASANISSSGKEVLFIVVDSNFHHYPYFVNLENYIK